MTIAYKAVYVLDNGVKMSAMYQYLPEKFPVEYKEGIPTLPKYPGSLLMAWQTLNAAIYFAANHIPDPYSEVWECDVVETKKSNNQLVCMDSWENYIEMFWNNGGDWMYNITAPMAQFALFCEQITLTKRVWVGLDSI